MRDDGTKLIKRSACCIHCSGQSPKGEKIIKGAVSEFRVSYFIPPSLLAMIFNFHPVASHTAQISGELTEF